MTGHTQTKGTAYLHRIHRRSERASKKAILDVVERRAHGRLLDCGCGDGEFTVKVACRARVSEAYGIECVDERIREASDRGIIVTKGDLNGPLPYKTRFFNIVHANQIVEQLLDVDLFLEEMKRVLRPDGYAILSISNLASWHDRLPLALRTQPPPAHLAGDGTGDNGSHSPQATRQAPQGDGHLLVFGCQGLSELCRYHGFWVERLTFTGYYALPPHVPYLMSNLGTAHAGFLIAKLRPRS